MPRKCLTQCLTASKSSINTIWLRESKRETEWFVVSFTKLVCMMLKGQRKESKFHFEPSWSTCKRSWEISSWEMVLDLLWEVLRLLMPKSWDQIWSLTESRRRRGDQDSTLQTLPFKGQLAGRGASKGNQENNCVLKTDTVIDASCNTVKAGSQSTRMVSHMKCCSQHFHRHYLF